jgi:hypothetical protein
MCEMEQARMMHSQGPNACSQDKGPWSKEVHFFNQWPLPRPPKREFLRCFPSRTWNIAKHPNPHAFTLVDATPDYMFTAIAPARIKSMWPQAKFLVLLRVCSSEPSLLDLRFLTLLAIHPAWNSNAAHHYQTPDILVLRHRV